MIQIGCVDMLKGGVTLMPSFVTSVSEPSGTIASFVWCVPRYVSSSAHASTLPKKAFACLANDDRQKYVRTYPIAQHSSHVALVQKPPRSQIKFWGQRRQNNRIRATKGTLKEEAAGSENPVACLFARTDVI